MKAERAWTALINHASSFINQINAIGPPGVRLLCGVVEIVDKGGKFDAEFPYAHVGYLCALSNVLWARKNDLIANVALHLPDITRMSFENVNSVELYPLTVLVGKLIKSRNLPPKWRSGVAAKNQDYGFVVPKRSQVDLCGLVKGGEREVRRAIADVQKARSGRSPSASSS